MSDTKIGMNYNSFMNKELHLGEKIGSFGTKKEALESAQNHKGSEVVFQNGTKWEVQGLKEAGAFTGALSDVKKYSGNDVFFDTHKLKTNNMKNLEISFVEEDKDYQPTEQEKKLPPVALDKLSYKANLNNTSQTKIGMNFSLMNKDLHVGKTLGTFSSKESALKAAQNHQGSEIISQKSNKKWEVKELKEAGAITGVLHNVGKYSKPDMAFDTANLKKRDMNNIEVSFIEDDVKKSGSK